MKEYVTRKTWRNQTGNQTCDPLRRYTPTTLEELVEVVKEGERLERTVRAVGSGHSWSDVALTPGFLVEPTGLSKCLELEEELLRPRVDPKRLARVEGGMRIRELNEELRRRGLALSQMGGYDGQTVAGVISTSTHGSGMPFGPLSDFVRSIDLVGSGGAVYRIEPPDGPTDGDAFRRRYGNSRELKQRGDWFNAVVVGMGCMGLIYAVTLEVEPAYWLKEVRAKSSWEEVKAALRDGAVLRDDQRRYEVYLNPHRRDGVNRCLVTTRKKTTEHPRWPPHRRRNSLPELLAWLPITSHVLNFITDMRPSWTPWLLDRALQALADEQYTSLSYMVLNIGTANLLPAYSAEIGVPIDDSESHIKAVDRVIEIADEHRRIGSVYHTSPISLRFVKASEAYMSMMQGRDTMMIELIQMTRTEGGYELLAAYEKALENLDGRPHWGQVNQLGSGAPSLRELYPRYADWLEVHRQLNSSGVFDSPFSIRVGIAADRLRG